jgi:hypothetical protein
MLSMDVPRICELPWLRVIRVESLRLTARVAPHIVSQLTRIVSVSRLSTTLPRSLPAETPQKSIKWEHRYVVLSLSERYNVSG